MIYDFSTLRQIRWSIIIALAAGSHGSAEGLASGE